MTTRQQRDRPLDAAVNPNAETASQQGPVPDDEAKRRERIAVAAYYHAERRGFREGGEREDWLAAERQIDQAGAQETPRPARPQDDVTSPDHMIPKHPPPMGPPHDPLPGKPAGMPGKPKK
jgi:hypothetical protein